MKFIEKNNLELSDTPVTDLFISEYMPNLDEKSLKVYLLILLWSKNEKDMSVEEIGKKLGYSKFDIDKAMETLEGQDLIIKMQNGYTIENLKEIEINKSYMPKIEQKRGKAATEKEMRRMAAINAINESYFQGIMSLSWYVDISTWFDKYMFAEDVMIALFHYCQERKALSKNYVQTVAEGWYNGGVKTFEQLEEYFENLEKLTKIKKQITKALGINRNLTSYEEQYIKDWLQKFNYNFDVIEHALKKTVAIANPTLNYVNGILKSWDSKGYRTLSDIIASESVITKNNMNHQKNKVAVGAKDGKPSNYQNFEQRGYDNLDNFYDNM